MLSLEEQIQQLFRQEQNRIEEKSQIGNRFMQMNSQFNGYWNEEL